MKRTITTVAIFGAAVLAPAAESATVQLCGPTICYVYDDGQAAIANFGTPTLAGDSVFFTPTSFRAESLNGAGIDIDDATFLFDSVFSHDGSEQPGTGLEIATLSVVDDGDYRIVGGDAVDATLRLQAVNVASAENVSVTEMFDASGDSAGTQDWSLTAALLPDSTFAAASEELRVTVQNTLTATTDGAGELAWIQKKFSLTATTIVPIPAAAWLFASGLGLLGWMRRRTG